MTLARTLSLAFLIAASFSAAAQARTRHVDSSIPSFDRAGGGSEIGARILYVAPHGEARPARTAGLKQIRKKRHRQAQPVRADRANGHLLVAASGAKTSVSTVARPHFVCLLTRLEAAGYHIDFMGGYASRGNASAHPTGNALDINQTSRNVVTRRLPSNATELARDCGLVHGAVWSHPDQGHFEMPRKYGYVIHRHRTRYAAAR